MNAKTPSYRGYRFPSEIISHAVWLYYRFCLSFRDVEDLLAERGIIVSNETIRQWSRRFGAEYARKLKRREGRLGDTWYLDEVFVTIQGQRQYLWRAVDQDGDVCPLNPEADHLRRRHLSLRRRQVDSTSGRIRTLATCGQVAGQGQSGFYCGRPWVAESPVPRDARCHYRVNAPSVRAP